MKLRSKSYKPIVIFGLTALFSLLVFIYLRPSNSHVTKCSEVIPECFGRVTKQSMITQKQYSSFMTLSVTDYQHYITYKIIFNGDLKAETNTDEFTQQVSETLIDPRGWSRAGYTFARVDLSSKADFLLHLIEPSLLDLIPGCDSNWSCRSGRNVYINEDRWNTATSAWNDAGGELREYRHMVVNHEVGHWLGLGHSICSGKPDELAPIMQQQSINLYGCKFNPWPLESEIQKLI